MDVFIIAMFKFVMLRCSNVSGFTSVSILPVFILDISCSFEICCSIIRSGTDLICRYTHLVLLVVVVLGTTSSKKAPSFQIGSG